MTAIALALPTSTETSFTFSANGLVAKQNPVWSDREEFVETRLRLLFSAKHLEAPPAGCTHLVINLSGPLRGRLADGGARREIALKRFGILHVGPESGIGIDLQDSSDLLLFVIGDAAVRRVERVLGHAITGIDDIAHAEPDELCRSLAITLQQEMTAPETRGPGYVSMLATTLLTRAYLRVQDAVSRRASGHSRLQEFKIRRVRSFIDANISEAITLKELAEVAGISRYHFARSFKATVGCTPHQYLIERRLEHCKELLRNSQLGLAEVALASGFGSQSHMTTTFKQFFGITPKQFRDL